MEAGRPMDVLVAENVFGMKPCRFEYEGGISGIVTYWKCQHEDSRNCYPEDLGVVLLKYSAEDGINAAWAIVELMKTRPNTSDSYGFHGRSSCRSWTTGRSGPASFMEKRQTWKPWRKQRRSRSAGRRSRRVWCESSSKREIRLRKLQ